MTKVQRTKLLIVGSGGAGLSAAVMAKRSGVSDYVLISQDDGFGGTWWTNRYPGCAVDTPVHSYQLSFAPSSEWSRLFAQRDELAQYFENVAVDFDVRARTRFNVEMLEAHWCHKELHWEVLTTDGTYLAEIVAMATGGQQQAILPDLAGQSDFKGNTFHSSQWPEGYLGHNDRVAVIGTGASAWQIVPALQPHVAHLTIFQRTPSHVEPRGDHIYSPEERDAFRNDPALLEAQKVEFQRTYDDILDRVILGDGGLAQEVESRSLKFLHDEVADPGLREALTPPHPYGCKRVGKSDVYYRSLQQANVTLIPEAAASLGEHTVHTASGRSAHVDTIVMATGFNFGGDALHRVHRRDGRTVGEYQAGHPRAFKSISVAGCPNLFLVGVAGPNNARYNGLAGAEFGARYMGKAIEYMNTRRVRALEVDEEAEVRWKAWVDSILDQGPAVSGGCLNYFQDELGHNKAAWPGSITHMQEQLAAFDAWAYNVIA